MTSIPSWTTPAGFLFTASELVSTSTSVIATGGTGTTYKTIAGSLPSGLSISSTGTISGTPNAVLDVVNSKFVIRATNSSTVADRTFNINVAGRDNPTWSTPSGFLTVGVYNEQYAYNNQWVDFQLASAATQAPASSSITYSIANGAGELPPGLKLDKTGRIFGFVTVTLGYNETNLSAFPKVYQFTVTASDSISTTTRLFKIMVVTTDTLLNESSSITSVGAALPATIYYVQPMQWLNESDLGTIRAGNNQALSVAVYDPAPYVGTITYTIITGTSVLADLPEGLTLEPTIGYIYGTVPYQPAYTRNYTITVEATKVDVVSFVTSNTFTLSVKGEVESTIAWVTGSNLGSINTGIVSELAVVAQQLNSDYSIKYELSTGSLPPGLTLERDGSLSGRVDYDNTGTYTFGVIAMDVYELSAIEREFTVTVTEIDTKKYTQIYFKPFLTVNKREEYRNFITNDFTFDPSLIYRYYDSNFGVQPEIKMILEFGIEQINLGDYVTALSENFYRKRFYFGDVKKAIAKDSTGTVIYEVVYVDVADDMVNSSGISSSSTVYNNGIAYHPASIDNMRTRLSLLELDNGDPIGINEYNQPRFMRTPQTGDYKPPNYMRVIPLCYALPGQGDRIISRIKLSGFDFKQLDFEVDRLIVQESADNTTAKYLLLNQQALGDVID
jgi:hypothetical protein